MSALMSLKIMIWRTLDSIFLLIAAPALADEEEEKKDERKQLVKSAKMPGLGCGDVKPIQAMSGF